jgi:hypothetical protein
MKRTSKMNMSIDRRALYVYFARKTRVVCPIVRLKNALLVLNVCMLRCYMTSRKCISIYITLFESSIPFAEILTNAFKISSRSYNFHTFKTNKHILK